MDLRAVQRLVDIDVAKSADKTLIQQDRLDRAELRDQEMFELFWGHREDVGAQFGQVRGPFDSAKLANVVVEKKRAVELEGQPGVGTGVCVQPQRSRHPQTGNHTLRIKVE
jgi:hypothetical protein